MIRIYTQFNQGQAWIDRYKNTASTFACVLGFTATGSIPGISAAGLTPEDRQYTACADAEFLYYGNSQPNPQYPLPPLVAGASPVMISRAVVELLNIPVYLFDAGLPHSPAVPAIHLGGMPAKCLSGGTAMEISTVHHLLEQGLQWGERLASNITDGYLIIGECVVGGTTTALAILTGLGIAAAGKVNSSHPTCNHDQKWQVVQAGLKHIQASQNSIDPLKLVAAVGDPMQVVVAGMAIAASRSCGVILAGGTQMLAVYALTSAIARAYNLSWQPAEIIVGTTRWVTEDPSGSTVALAQLVAEYSIDLGVTPPPLFATQLNFSHSRYPQLQAYEQGFVKEGMGAGGTCIAAYLSHNWQQNHLLEAIEYQLQLYQQIHPH
ncbi:MAG: TIGR00303 family protein [Calothrix sp. MO_192.B10]|nr:TIGR00303 family protein [Calothrix sp. MO_192.B10]